MERTSAQREGRDLTISQQSGQLIIWAKRLGALPAGARQGLPTVIELAPHFDGIPLASRHHKPPK